MIASVVLDQSRRGLSNLRRITGITTFSPLLRERAASVEMAGMVLVSWEALIDRRLLQRVLAHGDEVRSDRRTPAGCSEPVTAISSSASSAPMLEVGAATAPAASPGACPPVEVANASDAINAIPQTAEAEDSLKVAHCPILFPKRLWFTCSTDRDVARSDPFRRHWPPAGRERRAAIQNSRSSPARQVGKEETLSDRPDRRTAINRIRNASGTLNDGPLPDISLPFRADSFTALFPVFRLREQAVPARSFTHPLKPIRRSDHTTI